MNTQVKILARMLWSGLKGLATMLLVMAAVGGIGALVALPFAEDNLRGAFIGSSVALGIGWFLLIASPSILRFYEEKRREVLREERVVRIKA